MKQASHALDNPRAAAAAALVPILEYRGSLSSLDDSAMDPRDRGFFRALCFGVCRTLPRLEALAGLLLSRGFKGRDRDIHALLLVGLYQLLYMRVPSHAAVGETAGAARQLGKSWATKVLNACLRRCQREQSLLEQKLDNNPEFRLMHPQWLLDAIRDAWPQQADDIIAANNTSAPMTLRVNRAHLKREAYLQRLEEISINATSCHDANDGITLQIPMDTLRLPGFEEGDISVQDESAQLAAPMLISPLLDTESDKPLRILDACSAPGGKSMHLIECAIAKNRAMTLVALDSDGQRLKRVEDGIKRIAPPDFITYDIIKADASELDWWDGQRFDAVLLDAPCSGTGVIRRHPDIKRLRKDNDITSLAKLQGKLLENLWPVLKPGGLMLYATCSIMPTENQSQIELFITKMGDVKLTMPDVDWGIDTGFGRQRLQTIDGSDGFFYSLLEKAAGTV